MFNMCELPRNLIARKRFGEAALGVEVIFTQTYSQGSSYRNVAL